VIKISATAVSSETATISVRGTMTCRTIRSANSIARPTMTRSLSLRTPLFVDIATSIFSSCSLCASISSAVLMPNGRSTAFALTLTSQTNGRKAVANQCSGSAVQRVVGSARWMAKYFGACSPTTRCRYVTMAKAIAKESAWNAASEKLRSQPNAGSMRVATAGSPTMPKASDAPVMPTWQAERYASMFSLMWRPRRARRFPAAASSSS
jgi:hypothetical protein